MSLIFDRFRSTDSAEAFIEHVRRDAGLEGQVFMTDQEAYDDDARPWVCEPPIVHIDRVDNDTLSIEEQVAAEERVEALAEQYGGVYCGT